MIYSLQVFRGLAALAVVVHHTALSTGAFVEEVPDPYYSWMNMGLLGVDFFFVLSGFIIMYVHMNDKVNSSKSIGSYVFKRISRIYPAYLPIGIGMIILYSVIPGVSGSGGREFSFLSSVFLIPTDYPPALSVAWTLIHEMFFYTLFLVFFWSRIAFFWMLLAWFVLIVIFGFFYEVHGWFRYIISPLNIEFMLGLTAALVVRKKIFKSSPLHLALAGVGVMFLSLYLMQGDVSNVTRLIFASGVALVVVAAALLELNKPVRWPPFLIMLGGASFSIYLIHNPLVSFTQRIAGLFDFSWVVAVFFGVVISIVAGFLYHYAVEKPLTEALRKPLQ